MAKFTLGNEERETHVMWNAKDKIATIFTADPTMQRKLDKLCGECEEYKLVKQDDWGGNPIKYYSVSSKYIGFKKPRAAEWTEERKQATAERMRNYQLGKSHKEEI